MNRIFGAILLVAGMSIGTGMLALPVVTSFAGFYPTLILLLVCWFFMLMTGLMVVDVHLFTGLNANLISMSEKTLGRYGKAVSWICYLFLFYAIQAAHIAASASIFHEWLPTLPPFLLPLLLTVIFGGFIYAGTRSTDLLNRLVILGLAGGYLLLIVFVPKHIDFTRLEHINFKPLLFNIPIVLTSFGFQNIVPTLSHYLGGDRKKIRLSIIVGSFLPFFLYAFWEFLVLGVIPLTGKVSLLEAYKHGESATIPLMQILQNPLIKTGTSLFSFSAILASFLGISLALIDFLVDGLRLPQNHKGRAFGFLLAFFFPILFVYVYPEGFIFALQLAGIIAVILVGILPCLMTASLPIVSYWKSHRGKILMIVTLGFFLLVEVVTILIKIGVFSGDFMQFL